MPEKPIVPFSILAVAAGCLAAVVLFVLVARAKGLDGASIQVGVSLLGMASVLIAVILVDRE